MENLGISALPEAEKICCWVGAVEGSKGNLYEGLSYKLSLRFPLDYPFKPPKVKFENPCYRPNVDQYGNICLDVLQDMWSSAYDIRTILLSIQSLPGGEHFVLNAFIELSSPKENLQLADTSYLLLHTAQRVA